MEPKFQSSFIPKSSVATSTVSTMRPTVRDGSILGFVAGLIFSASVILALGIFAYQLYLNYSIKSMAANLEDARAALEPETVNELTDLDKRIASTDEIISKYSSLSVLFSFLEDSTLRAVRFSNLSYATTPQGLVLTMRGEAQGYAALALQAEAFNKSEILDTPVFSDLNLDDRGNVVFSVKAGVNPNQLSYKRQAESIELPAVVVPAATSTATTTPI